MLLLNVMVYYVLKGNRINNTIGTSDAHIYILLKYINAGRQRLNVFGMILCLMTIEQKRPYK